jgi:hypothetical protein
MGKSRNLERHNTIAKSPGRDTSQLQLHFDMDFHLYNGSSLTFTALPDQKASSMPMRKYG